MTESFISAGFSDAFHFPAAKICNLSCRRRQILPVVGNLCSWMAYWLNVSVASGLQFPYEVTQLSYAERPSTTSIGHEQRSRTQGQQVPADPRIDLIWRLTWVFLLLQDPYSHAHQLEALSQAWDKPLSGSVCGVGGGRGEIGNGAISLPPSPGFCKRLFLHVGNMPEEQLDHAQVSHIYALSFNLASSIFESGEFTSLLYSSCWAFTAACSGAAGLNLVWQWFSLQDR